MPALQVATPLALATSLLVAAISSWAQPARSDEMMATRIDALVRPEAEAQRLSGVVLVARGNQVLFQGAYGFASWEQRAPNSLTTRFGIGSITKALTQTLTAVLVEAGRLDVEAAVDRYIPGFPRGPGERRPTIGHLLTHRAGVPHRVTSATDEMQVLHPADIVARVQATGLLFDPGSRRLYSSAGYTVNSTGRRNTSMMRCCDAETETETVRPGGSACDAFARSPASRGAGGAATVLEGDRAGAVE